jgi:uncharacterized protein
MNAGTHNSGCTPQERTRSMPTILAFFVLAFAWSWGIGFAGTQVATHSPHLGAGLMMAAGFGPSLAGFAVVAFWSTGAGLRDWIARCLNWRVGWRWFLFAFAIPPTVMLLALAIHRALGGAIPVFTATDHISMAIANFGFIMLVGGPLGEEFGWRGYAMSALGDRLGWRPASLIIGAIWGLWHMPLLFLASSAQSHMPISLFMFNILAGSVVFGWLFERTAGSVLPALALHTSLNAWAGILGIVPTAVTGGSYAVVTGLLVLIALTLFLTADAKVCVELGAVAEGSRP